MNLLSGFEASIKNMYKGEKSVFVVKPNYAYGKEGLPEKKIPPNAVLEYEIELLAFEKVIHILLFIQSALSTSKSKNINNK